MNTEHWFRWHIGTVADPKLGFIATRAGCRKVEVLGVWASLLEAAATADDRGTVESWNAEVVAFNLGIGGDLVATIVDAMQGLLLDGMRIRKWSKRQPKREDNSTSRTRDYRARHRASRGVTEPGAASPAVTVPAPASPSVTDPAETASAGGPGDDPVTQGDAAERSVTQRDARGEEKREEKDTSSLRSDGISAVSAEAEARDEIRPAIVQWNDILFGPGLKFLASTGVPEKHARSMIGKWVKRYGRGETAAALAAAHEEGAAEPMAYVSAILQRREETRARDAPNGRRPYGSAATASGIMNLFAQEDRNAAEKRGGYPPGDDEPLAALLPPARAH